MQFNLGPGLEALKVNALVEIDRQAEACRLSFITGGAGQAMEYQATEIEGKRALNAIDAGQSINQAEYPFIMAELQAYVANGIPRTFQEVATEVVTLADGWALIGSAIKTIRRTAKLKIDAAATSAEVLAAVKNINWPTPGMV